MTLRKKLIIAGVVFLLLVLLISSFFGKKGLVEIYQVNKKLRALLEEIKLLEREKARLEREIESLKNNVLAVEEEARRKLWLIKPDEKVVVKPDKDRKEK